VLPDAHSNDCRRPTEAPGRPSVFSPRATSRDCRSMYHTVSISTPPLLGVATHTHAHTHTPPHGRRSIACFVLHLAAARETRKRGASSRQAQVPSLESAPTTAASRSTAPTDALSATEHREPYSLVIGTLGGRKHCQKRLAASVDTSSSTRGGRKVSRAVVCGGLRCVPVTSSLRWMLNGGVPVT